MECPLCGHVWAATSERAGPQPLGQFVMTEIDLLAQRCVDDKILVWGGGEDIASIGADVNRWSAPCRS
jgi:hypothetical protein